MKYYAVVRVNVTDPAWVADYLADVTRIAQRHGGTYLARTGSVDVLEGGGDHPGTVIIVEYPSKEAAMAFYEDPEYQPHLQRRLAGSTGEYLLVAGKDSAAT